MFNKAVCVIAKLFHTNSYMFDIWFLVFSLKKGHGIMVNLVSNFQKTSSVLQLRLISNPTTAAEFLIWRLNNWTQVFRNDGQSKSFRDSNYSPGLHFKSYTYILSHGREIEPSEMYYGNDNLHFFSPINVYWGSVRPWERMFYHFLWLWGASVWV